MSRLLPTRRVWLLVIAVVTAALVIAWWLSRDDRPAESATGSQEPAAASNPDPGSGSMQSKTGSGSRATGKVHVQAAGDAPGPEGSAAPAPVEVKVFGRVTGQDGKTPVAFVDVIFSSKGAESTATSDATGAYSLQLGPGSYRVRAIGDRVMAVALPALTVGSSPRRYDIRVKQDSVIRGHARYDDGGPAAGAIVVPHIEGKVTSLAALGELGSAEVQADGSFELVTVPGTLILDASSQSAAGRVRVPALKPGEAREKVDITLVSNGYVDGVVLDPKGKPIGDAKVLVSMHIPGTGEYSRIPISTDAAGHFRYQVIRPTDTIVEATARGYAQSDPVSFHLDPGKSRNGIEVVLHEADRSLSGHVLDDAGRPLALVQVAQGQMGSKERYKKTYTNPDGYFIISGLGPGPHRLRFRKKGYEQVRKTKVEATSSDLEIVMPRIASSTPGH